MLKVGKIYQSIQGEGPNAGCPATFIELNDNAEPMEDNKIAETLCKLELRRLLVITGVEPLMQISHLSEEDRSFLHKVRFAKEEQLQFSEIEVETQGMIIPGQNTEWNFDNFIVIPKIFTDESAKRMDEILSVMHDMVYLKLEVYPNSDIPILVDWIQKKVKKIMMAEDIYLCPRGNNLRELREVARKLYPISQENGFRLNPNMMLWIQNIPSFKEKV